MTKLAKLTGGFLLLSQITSRGRLTVLKCCFSNRQQKISFCLLTFLREYSTEWPGRGEVKIWGTSCMSEDSRKKWTEVETMARSRELCQRTDTDQEFDAILIQLWFANYFRNLSFSRELHLLKRKTLFFFLFENAGNSLSWVAFAETGVLSNDDDSMKFRSIMFWTLENWSKILALLEKWRKHPDEVFLSSSQSLVHKIYDSKTDQRYWIEFDNFIEMLIICCFENGMSCAAGWTKVASVWMEAIGI